MDKPKTFSLEHLLTVCGAVVLFSSQVIAAAVAAAWAFAGIAGLGDIGFYVLGAIFGSFALYASFAFAREALKSEPLYI